MSGDLVFLSGQVGKDPQTGETGGTVREQTAAALANLKAVLVDAGLDLGDVVKTTVFLTDVTTIDEMNAVYLEAFPEPLPCRSTIGVAGLPAPEFKVEIEAVARVRG
ncbi:RidA family protein [Nocardioides sp. L-11A]|uniref:RidA family protein n=1 Tax=Nocardioides sp. L-11A TaxID=3043848 RepID=UPI00249C5F67|nr:RidA family protein [Nocardioides sp. L-11A]